MAAGYERTRGAADDADGGYGDTGAGLTAGHHISAERSNAFDRTAAKCDYAHGVGEPDAFQGTNHGSCSCWYQFSTCNDGRRHLLDCLPGTCRLRVSPGSMLGRRQEASWVTDSHGQVMPWVRAMSPVGTRRVCQACVRSMTAIMKCLRVRARCLLCEGLRDGDYVS